MYYESKCLTMFEYFMYIIKLIIINKSVVMYINKGWLTKFRLLYMESLLSFGLHLLVLENQNIFQTLKQNNFVSVNPTSLHILANYQECFPSLIPQKHYNQIQQLLNKNHILFWEVHQLHVLVGVYKISVKYWSKIK